MSKLLAMMMKKRKEIFSNVLAYDKTMFLCHFEQNINNIGSVSFRFYDGVYGFNSDSKFGSYSVANSVYNMTFVRDDGNDIQCYPRTLECWFKPIIDNYSFNLGLSNSDWTIMRFLHLENNNNYFGGDQSVPFSANIQTNNWYHIALTYSLRDTQLEMVFWLNGEYCATASYSLIPFVQRFYFSTGTNLTASGLVDELVLHDYVRYTKNFEVQNQPYIIQSEYEEVDYIESTGTQYIDTGISAPNGFKFEVCLNILNGQGRDTIIGSHNLYSPYGRNFISLNKSSLILEFGLGDNFSTISAPPTNSFFVLSGNTYNDGRNNILTLNDTTIYNSSSYSNGSRSTNNLLLFTNQYFIANPDMSFLIAKLKYCKIWDNNDNLLRDMVAVYSNSLNQYGMYDNISGQFFSNSGSGEFIGG